MIKVLKKLASAIVSSPRLMYAGSKVLLGALYMKAATVVKVFEGDTTQGVTDFGHTWDAGSYSIKPLTFSGAFQMLGQGFLISGAEDLATMGNEVIEEWILNRWMNRQIDEGRRAREHAERNPPRLHGNKKKRRKEQKLEDERKKTEKIVTAELMTPKNQQLTIAFYRQLRKQIFFGVTFVLELALIAYFISTLVDPVRKSTINKGTGTPEDSLSNHVRFIIDGSIALLASPKGILGKLLQPNYAMATSALMFCYSLLEGLIGGIRIVKTGDLEITEKPITGILSGTGYVILSQSSLIIIEKLHMSSKMLGNVRSTMFDSASDSVREYLRTQDVDRSLAELFVQKTQETATARMGRLAEQMIGERAYWIPIAHGACLYGSYKFCRSVLDAVSSYLLMRKKEPLQNRMATVRRAFTERPHRSENYWVSSESNREVALLLRPLAPVTHSVFPQETVDPEKRARKLLEQEARAARAEEREAERALKERNALNSKRDAKISAEKQKQKSDILEAMVKLNPTKQKILGAILKKGKHLQLGEDDLIALFDSSGSSSSSGASSSSTPGLPYFSLQTTKNGAQISFNGSPITGFDRLHRGKNMNEKVFNQIREQFVILGITEETVVQTIATTQQAAKLYRLNRN